VGLTTISSSCSIEEKLITAFGFVLVSFCSPSCSTWGIYWAPRVPCRVPIWLMYSSRFETCSLYSLLGKRRSSTWNARRLRYDTVQEHFRLKKNRKSAKMHITQLARLIASTIAKSLYYLF
jgi:hypothetical protein